MTVNFHHIDGVGHQKRNDRLPDLFLIQSMASKYFTRHAYRHLRSVLSEKYYVSGVHREVLFLSATMYKGLDEENLCVFGHFEEFHRTEYFCAVD
jgi:hypothetical protein